MNELYGETKTTSVSFRRSLQRIEPEFFDGSETQMNVLLCETAKSPLGDVVDLLTQTPEVKLVAVARTGRDAIEVLNSEKVDVSIHSEDTVDLSRLIRPALNDEVALSIARVVASASPSTPLLVKAHQLGFDGVLAVPESPQKLASELNDVVGRRTSLSDHPTIKALHLSPGTLTRKLKYSNQTEIGIADLMGIGLSDHEIATAMQISTQAVRNHIEQLIHDNGLSNRTQLAVLRAIDWSIPDFA